MLERFLNHKLQQFPILTNATTSRMRWRLWESSFIAKPKMPIGVMRSIRQESERWV